MSSRRQKKQRRNKGLAIFLSLTAMVFLVFIVGAVVQFVEKQNAVLQQGGTEQNKNQNNGMHVGLNFDNSWLDLFREDTTEEEWDIIKGEPVGKELLYGYYLPLHCSGTEISNIDVVQNMFEEKEWSTYLSATGKVLTLSAIPLQWVGSEVSISLISSQTMDSLKESTGYLHGLAGERSYKEMIRQLYPEYGFATVTFYDDRRNLYLVNCAYTIEENEMKLVMIHYNREERAYSLIPMETYQVIRENNEITIYKDNNFITYVPYNLCENASVFRIEAFSKRKSERYENIIGFTYSNPNPTAEEWPLYGCVYFADGTKASKAVFDFSKENQLSICWENKETDYFGAVVEIEGAGEITFSYKMVQDTGLILEKDGKEYYYLQKMNE